MTDSEAFEVEPHVRGREVAPSFVVETIIGALIALGGVALTQFVQARRENQRWERETKERSLSRFYDHRREAYVNFLTEFDRLRSLIWDYDAYGPPGPDPSDIEDLFEPLYERLTVLRIYGSDAAHKAAGMAMVELVQWTSTGRKDQDAINKAYDDYVELVRNDLGVSEPADATELVRGNA